MKEFILNGKFLVQDLTGVQRWAYELLREFSTMKELKVIVAMPPNAEAADISSANIEYVKVGKFQNNLWEQWSLPRFCKKKKLPLLCTGNIAPVTYKSYIILHDVTVKERTSYASNSRSRKIKFIMRCYINKNRKIFTVSEFTKSRIKYFYPHIKSEPIIVYPGYEHITRITEKKPEGIPEKYFFSVGSVNPNKNFKYILHLAKNNPDKNFVISGKKNLSFDEYIKFNNITNCYFTGYISNENLIWLYKHCEGFILPSLYEGFGMPPLEAIAAGCRKIFLSDIPVFKEVYGDLAKFFDPLDYDNTVDLNLEDVSDANVQKLLDKCTWANAAKSICDLIEQE